MNKLFTKLAAGFIGLTMVASVGAVIGSKVLEKSPVEANAATTNLNPTAGTNGTICTVNPGRGENNGVKVGTGSKGGDFTVSIPSNTSKITFYAAAWKDVSGLSLNISGGNANPSSINLTSDVGISGNPPFTMSGTPQSFTISFSGIKTETVVTFTTSSAKRCVAWDFVAETSASPRTLTSISVSGNMNTTTYTTNDDWNPEGLTVTAHYDDGLTENVTSSSTWSYTPAKPAEGVTSVVATATYSEKEASSTAQSVTVTKVNPILTIVQTDTGLTGSYGEVDWSKDGIDGKIHGMKNGTNIQFSKNSASYIYNTVAIPGYITNISIELASGQTLRTLTAYVGKDSAISSEPQSGGTPSGTSWNWDFDESDHFCYFRVTNTSGNAAYLAKISITYKSVSLVDPTGITLDDSTPISMDTYGYGKRNLAATVEPFNANDKTVTWGSSNSNVATVSDGVITPVGVGTTTVYGTTCNYVDDVTTPDLKASVSVTVTQAQYKKATFVPKSTSTLTSEDDYLVGGSASVSSDGNYNNEKLAIQLSAGKNATFTISNYTGMKISGIDLIMSSNATGGAGSLSVKVGVDEIYSIESCSFDNPKWNGAFSGTGVNLYKPFASDRLIESGENITLAFNASVSSLYVHSVAIRYLDASLEQWCQSFLDDYVCDPQGITRPSTDDWDDFGLEFIYLDDDLQELARNTTAKENGNVIEKAMYKYDYIIGKYGDLEDPTTGAKLYDNYIERTPIQMSLIRTPNILGTNENDSVTLIVVVAVISLTAVGAFFYIRRRRQHN